MKFLLLMLLPLSIHAQFLKKANKITVQAVAFQQICEKLLDMGYKIEKRDPDLQTVRTEMREYDKSFNAAFKLDIRVKDSVAIITGTFSAPWWRPGSNSTETRLWDNVPIFNITDSKGKTRDKTMQGYAWVKMNEFALSFWGKNGVYH